MKKSNFLSIIGSLGIATLSIFLISADHNDAPAVAGTSSDISDFYAFQGSNTSNLVFVVNVQGLLVAGVPTDQAEFDEAVMLEINIDRDNDLKEDLVIQAIKRGDSMYFFGPAVPAQTGLISNVATFADKNRVKISTRDDVETFENNGMKFFAGPRDDPFFFDLNQYNAVVNGSAADGFNNPGIDTFAGTNALSVVVEIPKSMLGEGEVGVNPYAPNTPIYNVWVEAKRKQ